MELHLNGEGQLRITLSENDMKNYALCAESMDYDDTATRRAFWEILDEAKKQTGFDAARERMLIQVFPHKSGGCEMRVTPVNLAKEQQHAGQLLQSPPSSTAPVHTNMRRPLLVKTFYAFSDAKTLLFCCAMLQTVYQGKSEAWFEPLNGHDGRYYLALRETGAYMYPFLNEFSISSAGVTLAYLSEHARPIAEKNAVSRLAGLCSRK